VLDDQELRNRFVEAASRVEVDVDADLQRVLGAGTRRAGQGRRTALLAAAALLVAVVVGGVVVTRGGLDGQRVVQPPAAPAAVQPAGTWVRTPVTGAELPAETAGVWTMVLGADGALALVPPQAWVDRNYQPNGTYLAADGTLRTNVFAAEACAGAAGTYTLDLDGGTLQLDPQAEDCALRAAVLGGRWERAP
jgi:hypothetical protein